MDPVTEEIRQRADIVDVVSQYVALRPAGHNRWKACCPFHDEKSPSFNVSRDKGFYKCFGCGVSGDVFKFLQQMENITFPEARKQLAERYGVALPRQGRDLTPAQQAAYSERDRLLKITAAAAAFFREQFSGNAGLPARDYARRRGLSAGTLDKFGIGYAPDAWDALHHHLINKYGFKPEDAAAAGLLIEKTNDDGRVRYYDRYRHRLMFPIWDEQGRAIAFGGRALEDGQTGNPDAKYINSPEGILFKKSRVLYGWHIARSEVGKRESIIVTEGYMDAIALHEAGFGNTIASLGTALTTQHVAMLRRLAPKVVYLCYDGDSAGMQAALRAAPLFAANQLDMRVVTLPGGEDPDTFVRKAGEVGFQNALRAAKLLSQYRLEMAIAGFDLRDVAQRKEAMRAAAEVVAGVLSDTERDAYITWLAEQWARDEGITTSDRLHMVEVAVRREIEAAKRRYAQSLQDRPGQSARNEEKGEVDQAVSNVAGGQLSGVAKAERALLATMLSDPTCRAKVLTALPPEQWTQDAHREIALVLQEANDDADHAEPMTPSVLMDLLPEESQGLVAELMLTDEAQSVPGDRVVEDWIARVQSEGNRHKEQAILDLVRQKLERAEPVSDDERAAYNAALLSTRRKTPVAATPAP